MPKYIVKVIQEVEETYVVDCDDEELARDLVADFDPAARRVKVSNLGPAFDSFDWDVYETADNDLLVIAPEVDEYGEPVETDE